jgi:uncharacterized RDD family membrane protein YckC
MQTSFDFTAPQNPLLRQVSYRQSLAVAPLGQRALSACGDLGAAAILSLALLVPVAVMLGFAFFFSPAVAYLLAAPPLICIAYKLFWFACNRDTPGISGCGLLLVTFDGLPPTRTDRLVRLVAGMVSLAAGTVGLLWALCDQDTFTWHDHISRTFLTAERPHWAR